MVRESATSWFLAHVLTLHISGGGVVILKAQTAMRAMKSTSRVPTLVLVAVPFPRFLQHDLKAIHGNLMIIINRGQRIIFFL